MFIDRHATFDAHTHPDGRVSGRPAEQLFQQRHSSLLPRDASVPPLAMLCDYEQTGPEVRRHGLFRTVGPRDLDGALPVGAGHPDAPGVAAHLAVLDERPTYVRLDVDFDQLAAVRAGDGEEVVHEGVTGYGLQATGYCR